MASTKLPSLIGVIHLPALAGAPGSRHLDPSTALQEAGSLAVQEAAALSKAGFQALIIENFGDTPFYKSEVPPETIACMSVIAAAVREAVPRAKLGINILRNDARAALAVAAITGCDFIRVNVLSGVVATDQGMIEGQAATLLRERDRLGADIQILADAHVKHATTLSTQDLDLFIEELALRSGADGVIVTGKTTGRLLDLALLKQAHSTAKRIKTPLYIGSGVNADNLEQVAGHTDGIIVGSALRQGGLAGAPLEAKRIREFLRLVQSKKVFSSKKKGKSKR